MEKVGPVGKVGPTGECSLSISWALWAYYDGRRIIYACEDLKEGASNCATFDRGKPA